VGSKPRKSETMKLLDEVVGELTFGKMLAAIREGEEMTLEEFGAKLDVSKQQLCDIEKDRRIVSIERAAAWAKQLGYHPGQFVQLAIQAALNAAGLDDLRVTVDAA
jgi:transcriptional regulator with XRE-family HTH domain